MSSACSSSYSSRRGAASPSTSSRPRICTFDRLPSASSAPVPPFELEMASPPSFASAAVGFSLSSSTETEPTICDSTSSTMFDSALAETSSGEFPEQPDSCIDISKADAINVDETIVLHCEMML